MGLLVLDGLIPAELRSMGLFLLISTYSALFKRIQDICKNKKLKIDTIASIAYNKNMDRYEAINLIVEACTNVQDAVVYDHAVFIEEINSFPTISVHCTSERIIHSLSDERYSVLGIEIRGYTHNELVEEAGEQLANEIERLLEQVDITDLKLIRVETDGGLMQPIGVCIITAGALLRR